MKNRAIALNSLPKFAEANSSLFILHSSFMLGACLSHIAKRLFALVGDILPVAGLYLVAGEELRAHAHAEDASLEPLREVFLIGRYATGHHDLRPRHRSLQPLHHVGTNDVAGEHLCQIAAQFLCLANLADGHAAWTVRNETTVAYGSNVRIEQRTHHEAGAQLKVERCGRSIDDAANAAKKGLGL